jgi:hypothetical protein
MAFADQIIAQLADLRTQVARLRRQQRASDVLARAMQGLEVEMGARREPERPDAFVEMCREEETRPASPPVVGDGKTIYVSFDGRTSVVSAILPDVVIPPAKKGSSLLWATCNGAFYDPLTPNTWNSLTMTPVADRNGTAITPTPDDITVLLWEDNSNQIRAVLSNPMIVGYVADSNGDNIVVSFAKEVYYAGT